MTIDELMASLQKMWNESPLGGQTVVHICIPMYEYQPIVAAYLDKDDSGAVALLEIGDIT